MRTSRFHQSSPDVQGRDILAPPLCLLEASGTLCLTGTREKRCLRVTTTCLSIRSPEDNLRSKGIPVKPPPHTPALPQPNPPAHHHHQFHGYLLISIAISWLPLVLHMNDYVPLKQPYVYANFFLLLSTS